MKKHWILLAATLLLVACTPNTNMPVVQPPAIAAPSPTAPAAPSAASTLVASTATATAAPAPTTPAAPPPAPVVTRGPLVRPTGALIINQDNRDASIIPEQWFDAAKLNVAWVYGSTSHGSQVITRLKYLHNVIDPVTLAFTFRGYEAPPPADPPAPVEMDTSSWSPTNRSKTPCASASAGKWSKNKMILRIHTCPHTFIP